MHGITKKVCIPSLFLLIIVLLFCVNTAQAYADESTTSFVVEKQEEGAIGNGDDSEKQNEALAAITKSEESVSSSAEEKKEISKNVNNATSINKNKQNDTQETIVETKRFIQDSKGLRYVKEDGNYAKSEWITYDGKKYYFGSDTYAVRWSQTIGGNRYYFDDDYTMHTGWLTWYSDKTQSYYNNDGIAQTGWQTKNGKRYYIDPETYHTVQWTQVIDNKRYYFNEDGSMHTGLLTWYSDGTKSFFDANGVIASGWQSWQGKQYYFDPSTYKAVQWLQNINGTEYYFGSDYSMHTGWLYCFSDGKYMYFSLKNGARYYGSELIDGISYNFGSAGRIYVDWTKAQIGQKAQQYSSSSNYLILVDRSNHKVAVFKGHQNYWILQHYWSCVTGAPSSPTITGSYYTTGFKRGSLSTDSRAIWCTQIWGGYFFHSILASESELGKSLSHGCIRLPYVGAQWIYNNVHGGTRVIIYN